MGQTIWYLVISLKFTTHWVVHHPNPQLLAYYLAWFWAPPTPPPEPPAPPPPPPKGPPCWLAFPSLTMRRPSYSDMTLLSAVLGAMPVAGIVDSDIRIEPHWDPEKKSEMVVWWRFERLLTTKTKSEFPTFEKAPRDSTIRNKKSYVKLQGCWQLLPHARGLDWISHLTGLVVEIWLQFVMIDVFYLMGFHRLLHESLDP